MEESGTRRPRIMMAMHDGSEDIFSSVRDCYEG
jgi:hypothetical protein